MLLLLLGWGNKNAVTIKTNRHTRLKNSGFFLALIPYILLPDCLP